MYIFYKIYPTMNILDPIFLSHVVSKIFASAPPTCFFLFDLLRPVYEHQPKYP